MKKKNIIITFPSEQNHDDDDVKILKKNVLRRKHAKNLFKQWRNKTEKSYFQN